jgi:hypothetical protein
MDGLSPAELLVFLQLESPEESISPNVTDGHVLWQAEYHTLGEWVSAQFLYTCEVPHKASQEKMLSILSSCLKRLSRLQTALSIL